MRILICDDDTLIIEQLQKYIESYFESNHLKCPELVSFTSGESLLADKNEKDIVFLDIEMPGMNGIYVGNELKKANKNVIIFVDYIITYFSSHQDSLSLIKRNFTWSMVQHSLEQEENNALRHQLLERLQASPTSHNYSQRELFNIVYMIVELCGSVCYTSIIEQVPDTIDHIKPLLYTMIRRILNHEPDQTNPDF